MAGKETMMPEPLTVTVDAKGIPQAPVDPSVKIPDRVAAEAARADTLHKQAYTPQPDANQPPQPDANQPPQAAPAPAPQAADPRASWTAEQWMQHARSMEGRYRQSQETVTTLQSHMTELGDELVRHQALARAPALQPQQVQQPVTAPVTPLLTKEDEDTYGADFLNVAQRAALQAVAPKLNALENENKRLQNQLRRQTIETINQTLDREVPNWQAINLSPKFAAFLRLPDIYSRKLRSTLLDEAHRAADAARVVAFFKGFLAEEEATGSTEFPSSQEPPPQAAPRMPTLPLETLTAPGHAKPAQGSTPAPANEPIWITRAQISKFYDNVRKGVYAGRQQDYLNDEAIIFECQKTGRVR